jgi:basic membrane protein A
MGDRANGEVAGAAINTFLIADVRGYTLFTQERGDEAAAKLAAKFAGIAREGVEARGGSVIELRGDEALAVFSSARQAIRAALDLQDLFVRESIADPKLPLLVGIGLDAGEAVPLEAGYRGGALNLAARLCGMAEPGEVLASREVTHLARKLDRVRYEDRGAVQLKGLPEPVAVIRVVSEDIDLATRLAELLPPPDRRKGGPPAGGGKPSWRRRALAGVVALALVAVGVVVLIRRGSGDAPSATVSPGVTGCEVAVDQLNDKGFHQAIYDGLTRASTELGTLVRARVSHSEKEDAGVLRSFVRQRCSLIVTGAAIQTAMTASAQANPSQRFLFVDPFEPPALANVLGINFRVDQAAFLAGYLAAGMTKSGKVGTFGGMPIPTVTPYMDGFAAGVMKYNADHGASVQLLGWNPADGTGSFISQSDFSAFGNSKRAREIAHGQITKGADIVFPVAGAAGVGAARTAREAGGVSLVGVDFDAFYQQPEWSDLWLTSVRKRYDVAVEDVMRLVVDGKFKGGGLFEGTLANGSVDLAPFHDLEDRVPADLKAELATLKAGIEAGTVSVDPREYLTS